MLQQGRTRASHRTDLITVLLGTWFSLGLFLDAWAHSNVPELETFFTPWHAVFYSGFAATGAWILWLVWRNVQAGRRGLDAVPVGYGPAVLALPVFAVFGAGDYLWHTLIGIEQGIDILFSPTHLGLITSMIVILTTPLRTLWMDKDVTAPSLRRFLPAALALSFTTALVLLFVSYADATIYGSQGVLRAFSFDKADGGSSGANRLASSITITNLVLITPLLLAARRFRLPVGTATILQVVVMLLSTAVANYENLGTAAAFLLSGIVIDVLLWWLRPSEERLREYRAFAFAAPLVTWVFFFAAAGIGAGGMPSVTEMWTGAPLVAALHGLLLAIVLVPTRR
ncbi:hypothetical protein ABZ816_14545 [Actinosynnema sp. NPDC047251]|uniref:Putative secreted protein n=1 Tax=Saccharothrix espanaensis (strain ATCC 51144 / DSM 44229 / JCM 9112 / NBRC 15066 / NRRL 15764) TaxID=1179773 RepID=K0JWA4_SACES|nr:hypothetical protein [Saccharothrix espanaensis]CCH29757.1 putative secreted protein [Saccharothrix espanaensis DSM 44229]